MTPSPELSSESALLAELARAVASAPRPIRGIEVGVGLSIALGKARPAVSCGGCTTPLAFQGIPATTNIRLREPFKLILADA